MTYVPDEGVVTTAPASLNTAIVRFQGSDWPTREKEKKKRASNTESRNERRADAASDEVRWTTIGKVDETSARKEGRVCHGS
jgi:hypothetical protein